MGAIQAASRRWATARTGSGSCQGQATTAYGSGMQRRATASTRWRAIQATSAQWATARTGSGSCQGQATRAYGSGMQRRANALKCFTALKNLIKSCLVQIPALYLFSRAASKSRNTVSDSKDFNVLTLSNSYIQLFIP